MSPAGKALWFIESHFASELTLDAIAGSGCVSRFHLARAFEAATGYPVMRYVRLRRLSEAARQLADGAPDILAVAVEAGYGSHEAFTRAFRDRFGLTPEAVRAQRRVDNLDLTEPPKMNDTPHSDIVLAPPRFEDGEPFLVAGLSARYACDATNGIPAQWQRFSAYLGRIPGQIGNVAYGVNHNADDAGHFDYLCGVAVRDFSTVPAELTHLRIPAQRYAVFVHREHVSAVCHTWNAIWNRWLPESGHTPADAPLFERYDEAFDPLTGMGGFEIWLPLKT